MSVVILATDKLAENVGTTDTRPDFAGRENNVKMTTNFDGRQVSLEVWWDL